MSVMLHSLILSSNCNTIFQMRMQRRYSSLSLVLPTPRWRRNPSTWSLTHSTKHRSSQRQTHATPNSGFRWATRTSTNSENLPNLLWKMLSMDLESHDNWKLFSIKQYATNGFCCTWVRIVLLMVIYEFI